MLGAFNKGAFERRMWKSKLKIRDTRIQVIQGKYIQVTKDPENEYKDTVLLKDGV